MPQYLQSAFDAVCKDAKTPETWYVVLMESAQVYAGPWEGGTWVTDTFVQAFQAFPTKEEADAAAAAVEKLAEELSQNSRREHGERCLMEMDWLEDRGLDADFLPEPDGESRFYVVVSQGIPQETRGPREYS
jgi:hypothetical protein